MKKNLLILTLITLIAPSFAFASWWNPASWSIFSSVFHSNPEVQVTNISTSSSHISTDTLVSTSTSHINKPTKKIVSEITPAVTAAPPSAQITQPSGTFCNGKYWSDCSVGLNLICPQTGNAYCQAPQQPVQQNGYQVCIAANATWDGTSFTSSGGYSCTCGAGYTTSPDKKACIPAPVKTGYQICSEAYPNQTWDGTYGSNGKYNCVCQTGYAGTSDGSCQLRQTQQPVSNECQQVDSQLQQARNAISAYQLHIKQQIADLYSGSMTKDQADQAAQDIQREADAHTAELSMTQSNAVIAYSSCHQLAPSHIYQTNCSSTGDYTSCSTY